MISENWAKLNIKPGECARPIGSGKQVWEVISINYQKQTITIERDLSQKTLRPDQLAGLRVINGTIQEFPLEVLSWQQPRYHSDLVSGR